MFKKYVYLFLVCYLFAQGVEAQITFDKEYPYVDSRQRSVISFSRDDGYIILASGNDYITIVKTDLAGDTLWVKYLDIGVPSTYDIGYIESACSDEEDNMYLKTYLTDYDLLKIDSVGNFIWGVNFPEYYPVWQVGPIYRNNFLWAVFKESPNKYYLYKINPVNGGAAWRTEICNSPGWALTSFTMNENGDAAASVVDSYEAPYFTEYNNRIYIKPADSSNFTYKTLYLCNDETYIEKLRYTGNELCGIARYPNASAPMDYSCYTRFTPSCNILLEEVISFDSDGSWVTTYNLNPDGDAVFEFSIYYFNSIWDSQLLSMNTNGDILWSAPLPDRLTSSIRYCNDGGYILTGSIDGHPYLYKTNDQGIVSVKNTGIPSEYIHTYPNPSNGLITF